MNIWTNNRARILVTSECNMNCTYCHNEGQSKTHTMISDTLVQRISDLMSLNERELSSISFSGGEALLHPKLFNYIEKLSGYSRRRTLITNGLLLNEENLNNLINSGITKIRLGVDSINKKKYRPTSGPYPKKPITETIELLKNRNINFELNVVLCQFNVREIESIIKYCSQNKISAKFFELVNVTSFGDVGTVANMCSKEIIPYQRFRNLVVKSIHTQRTSDDMRFADIIFDGDGFSLRYCHFLCDYGLCYKTGTRIDASGSVYSCMKQRGKFWISPDEPLESSVDTIRRAIQTGCGGQEK